MNLLNKRIIKKAYRALSKYNRKPVSSKGR